MGRRLVANVVATDIVLVQRGDPGGFQPAARGAAGLRRRHALLAAAAAAAPMQLLAARAQPPRIVLLMSDLRNPFFSAIARSFQRRFQALWPGPAQISVQSAGFDHDRQASHLDQALARGVDLIVVSPIDAKLLAPAVQRARDAGVRVIAVDSAVPGADLTVMTDNLAAGRSACEHLFQRMGGRGTLAVIYGPMNTAAMDRVRGCREVLARHPQITLVAEVYAGGGTKEGGLERMVAILLGTPRLDGLFAINDPTALGAETAAREAGRNEMAITSVDGSDEVSARLRDPGSRIIATAAQDPQAMGRLAAEGAVRVLKKQPVPQPMVVLPPRLVTGANVGGYPGWSRP